tara:strand:+ start:330 stop:560 length:231 start_codon:yes stop_codon:yes gene_type:complete
MEYPELDVYTKQGAGNILEKNNQPNKNKSTGNINYKDDVKDDVENDKKTIKLYKKKIIEQRNEIERLRKKLEKYEK